MTEILTSASWILIRMHKWGVLVETSISSPILLLVTYLPQEFFTLASEKRIAKSRNQLTELTSSLAPSWRYFLPLQTPHLNEPSHSSSRQPTVHPSPLRSPHPRLRYLSNPARTLSSPLDYWASIGQTDALDSIQPWHSRSSVLSHLTHSGTPTSPFPLLVSSPSHPTHLNLEDDATTHLCSNVHADAGSRTSR
jgi:hypothetical protein